MKIKRKKEVRELPDTFWEYFKAEWPSQASQWEEISEPTEQDVTNQLVVNSEGSALLPSSPIGISFSPHLKAKLVDVYEIPEDDLRTVGSITRLLQSYKTKAMKVYRVKNGN